VRTGVAQLLGKAGVRPADITAPIVHATTLITNALIEGKIGRAGIVTTAGFGDTLLIRNEHRYDMYDLQIEFPAPPVPRDRVVELAERTDPQGHALEAPTAEGLAAITEQLRAAKVEAVGVCLINSYANPANERIVAEHLRTELGVPVCISSEISPQIREYPRMITTACNAATMPVIGPYLDELQKWLAGRGLRRLGADDAVERWCRVGRRRRPRADPPGRVGPRRRCAGGQLVRTSHAARTGCCASTWAAPPPSPA
jgi:N-methylhydantoinase A